MCFHKDHKFTSNDKDCVVRDKTKNSLLLTGIFTVVVLLMIYEHFYIAFSIIFIYSLYMLYPERYLLTKIIKSAFAIKFYNVVIWFISYVITLKTLSMFYGVDEEYLKFSPVIVAIPVSICVLYFFLTIATGIFSTVDIIIGYLPECVKASYKQSIFSRIVKILQLLMIVSLIFFILAASSLYYVSRVAILSDASFISDCGVKQPGVMYLRKNNNECYRFILDRNVFSKQVIVHSKK